MAFFDRILAETLRFEMEKGDVTPVGPHTTGWRTIPYTVMASLRPGRATVRLDDGRCVQVNRGEAIVIPAGVSHKIEQHDENAVSQWMHANFTILERVDLMQFLELPLVLPREASARMGRAIAGWVRHRRKRTDDPVYQYARKNELGFRVLSVLAEVGRLREGAERRLDQIRVLGPVILYLDQHYAESLDRDALAAKAHLSPAQFHRVFLQCTGVSPMRFLREVRVRRAQRALMSTNLSVQEIARQVGYEDPFVFSKIFKRISGLGPRAYRERLKATTAGPY